MKLDSLSHLMQIVSGIILVAGVVLIVAEMQQTKLLAQAQLVSDSWGIGTERLTTQMGENSVAAVVKACNNEALTWEEAGVLSSKYQLHVLSISRAKHLDSIASFEDNLGATSARKPAGHLSNRARTGLVAVNQRHLCAAGPGAGQVCR